MKVSAGCVGYLVAIVVAILCIGAITWPLTQGTWWPWSWWEWVLIVIALGCASEYLRWLAEREGITID